MENALTKIEFKKLEDIPSHLREFFEPINTDHFAIFPQALVEIPIKFGCPEFVCGECKRPIKIHTDKKTKIDKDNYVLAKGCYCDTDKPFEKGIVLDPFMGSGTTAVVAKMLGRNYIGVELNPEYIKIAEKRLRQEILL